MNVAELMVWVLRVFGAGYLIGGLFMARQMWFWARITPSMNQFAQQVEDISADLEHRAPRSPTLEDDNGRPWWLFIGALLVAVAGAAMIVGHRLAVPLLAAIIVHQLLYFIRQRRRELAAASPEAAHEARPNRATVNGFFGALVMAVLAAWLYHEGVLL